MPIQKQVDELTVCPWHRYVLTYGWPGKKRLTCFHPDHLRKCTNQNNARFFNLEMSRIDIGLVQTLLSAHNNTENWQTKHQILSLFVNDFSKTDLQEMIPGLSKWWIDQARCHATDVGEGQPIHDKLTFCTQLDSVKMDHFVDYISRSCFFQDVAHGTQKLKLDSGEHPVIPAVIRTLIPSRIIAQYQAYCREIGFDPASESTLFRILEVCSASMQRSLHALHYITTEGVQAFDSLEDMVSTLKSA